MLDFNEIFDATNSTIASHSKDLSEEIMNSPHIVQKDSLLNFNEILDENILVSDGHRKDEECDDQEAVFEDEEMSVDVFN